MTVMNPFNLKAGSIKKYLLHFIKHITNWFILIYLMGLSNNSNRIYLIAVFGSILCLYLYLQ